MVIKNISWLLLEHSIRIIAGVVTASILARVLGVEGYGIFQYILGLVVIFKSLSYVNSAEIMVPKLANANIVERKSLMGSGFFIRSLFCAIAYLAFLLFIYFNNDINNDINIFYLAVILGFSILVDEAFGIITAFLQSQTMIKYRSILYIIFVIIRVSFLGFLYLLNITNIYFYALIYALESISMAIGLFLVYKILNKDLFFTFNIDKILSLLKDGLPFFVGIVFMCVFWRIDIVMTKFLSDDTTLGLYASAIQLFSSITAMAPIIATSFAPLFVYKFDNIRIIKKHIWFLGFVMLGIAICSATIIYFLSPILINIIFGSKFDAAADIFRYLLYILPFIFLNEALNLYIIKMKLGKISICKWGLALSSAIVAYIYFIPLYKAIGTVIGLGIGYFVACIFGIFVIIAIGKPNNRLL